MLTRSRTMAAPEAAGEIARMKRVSDTPRPTTVVETAPKVDPTLRTSLRTPLEYGLATGIHAHRHVAYPCLIIVSVVSNKASLHFTIRRAALRGPSTLVLLLWRRVNCPVTRAFDNTPSNCTLRNQTSRSAHDRALSQSQFGNGRSDIMALLRRVVVCITLIFTIAGTDLFRWLIYLISCDA